MKPGISCSKSSVEKFSRKTLIAVAAALLPLASAWAQSTPGQVQDTLKRAPVLKAPVAAPVIKSEAPKPSTPPPKGAQGKTVMLTGFEFTGVTLYSQGQLATMLQDYLNRPVTLLDIYAAADRVAEFYVNNGYTLASVNVPPQKIAGGVVQLEVIEGHIGKVTLEDNKSYTKAQLAPYLGEYQDGALYRGGQLENKMRQINELPGLTAKAVLKPGGVYGTSDLVIKTTEDRVSGAVFADNYGRENIGKTRSAATVTVNNPLGVEDQLQLLGLYSSGGRLRYGYAAYSVPLNYSGTRLAASFGYAGFTLHSPTEIEGSSTNGKLEVQHPLLRGGDSRADATFGISRTYSRTMLTPTVTNGTEITLAELGASYSRINADLGLTQISGNVASNFDSMDVADINNPVTGANGTQIFNADQVFRGELDFQQLQPLVRDISLLVRFNTVWSPDPLPDTSAFSLGGPQSVRGYAPGEVRGDRGMLLQITAQRRFDLGPARMTGRVFFDTGEVECADNRACATQPTGPATLRDTLTSVGAGFDADLKPFTWKVDVGVPRDAHVSSDGMRDGRLYTSLFMSF